MTTLATPSAARFVADQVPVPESWGPIILVARDGELWASLPDPDHVGAAPPPRLTRQVALVTGSHHQQVFWYETGRTRLLGLFPLTYLIAERRWIPRTAAFLQPPAPVLLSGTGHWNQVCISCHTTGGEARVTDMYARRSPANLSADSRVSEFGIACEACHGKGAAHVRSPRTTLDGAGRQSESARNIRNPARLDPRRSAEVCGQCHSVWEWHDKAGERLENDRGPAFSPGQVLARTRFVAQPSVYPAAPRLAALLADDPDFVRDAFWPDGTIAVAGREYNGLIDSPCFAKATSADRTMTCLSCHGLHQARGDRRPTTVWANDQLGEDKDGNLACLQCHQSKTTQIASHTHHRIESAGSRCYNCHMPKTTYGLLKTTRSHRITSPDARVSRSTGRPDACSLCHLDKPLAWTARYLAQWYGTPAPALDGDSDTTPAAVAWALSGDAQQRAVMAEAFGRADARAASDQMWVEPVLAALLDDPYPAVRLIAARSLARVAPSSTQGYDFLNTRERRMRAKAQALQSWRARAPAAHAEAISIAIIDRLTSRRDDRRVALRE
jgi:hypothetical protein